MLGLIDDAHGAWRCHAAFECSAVCPAGSIRARRSCGFVAACSGIGCSGWSAATTGRSAALVGSGLLVDRHRALLAAAAILVGLVVVVAAVRIPA